MFKSPNELLSIDEKYISNIGPSYWNIIHLEAFKITIDEIYNNTEERTFEKRNDFLKMLEYLIKNLKCECKNHAYQILMINTKTICLPGPSIKNLAKIKKIAKKIKKIKFLKKSFIEYINS